MYTILPLSSAARQVFTIDLAPDGIPLHARIEPRYLPAPDQWVFSMWDHSTEELLVNMIPLICSYGVRPVSAGRLNASWKYCPRPIVKASSCPPA